MTSQDTAWFSGPVKDAISLVAQRNCVFLVYIHDESEKTNTLNATLKDEQVKVMKTIKDHTVALCMEKNSESATLFGQFYPIQTVPILYFIKHGTIRDFGIETVSSQEIIDKINQVNAVVPAHGTSSAPAPPVPEQTIPSTSSPLAATPITTTATPSNPEEIKAKKAELQKQLDQVRKERAEREKQEAKDREIKRRQEAKLMQEAKQNGVDKENKLYFDKIRKEKLEDEAHRRKVRQQIATDRAEKIAQRNAEKQRQNFSSSLNNLADEENNNSNNNSNSHEFSNLNIRQLDGTNIRNRFEASTTLSAVREWTQQNRTDNSRKSYKLSSQFPTRLFTESDNDTTLEDLNLCPSATIIMKPIKSASSSSSLTSAVNNNRGIIGYAYSGPAPHELPPSQQQQPLLRNLRGGQRLGGESLDSSSPSATNNETSSSAQKRNPYATRVNTLQEDDMDDDEKKRSTYNGNSVNHE